MTSETIQSFFDADHWWTPWFCCIVSIIVWILRNTTKISSVSRDILSVFFFYYVCDSLRSAKNKLFSNNQKYFSTLMNSAEKKSNNDSSSDLLIFLSTCGSEIFERCQTDIARGKRMRADRIRIRSLLRSRRVCSQHYLRCICRPVRVVVSFSSHDVGYVIFRFRGGSLEGSFRKLDEAILTSSSFNLGKNTSYSWRQKDNVHSIMHRQTTRTDTSDIQDLLLSWGKVSYRYIWYRDSREIFNDKIPIVMSSLYFDQG